MTANEVIFGCEGLALTDWERDFFTDSVPLGSILFARNCESPKQIRALVSDLCDRIGRADAPVLFDQEGGRRFALQRADNYTPSPAVRSCSGFGAGRRTG